MINLATFPLNSILYKISFKSVLVDIVNQFTFAPFESISKASCVGYSPISWDEGTLPTHFAVEPVTLV